MLISIRIIIIIYLALLTACMHKPANEPDDVLSLKSPHSATAISSWEIHGALAAKNKSKSWSAAMNWTQSGPNSYQIRLMGPLGSGTLLIRRQGNVIAFEDGAKKISSTDAESLLLQQTGIRLPINNLYFWIRGLPAPVGIQTERRDKNKRIVQFKQSGYTIDLMQYTIVNGVALPTLIRLEGNGLMVKIVIKSWTHTG